MVKTPDELFEMWLDGEIVSGETRRDFCEKQGIHVMDIRWAFFAGMRNALLNEITHDVQ